MKKVINGKLYDTETATLVAEYDSGHYSNDFHSSEEKLYRTKKGAWFLHGKGGAMSRWSERCGSNCYCGGEGIEALGDYDARTWCEEHNVDVDVIKANFKVVRA